MCVCITLVNLSHLIMMIGCIEASCSAFLVNFPVQTRSKFGMGGVRLALHEMKILVSRYVLLIFVIV